MNASLVDGKIVLPHGKSIAHEAILIAAAQEKGCTCEPYVDWFTYKLWQEQGMQVQKGEHGIKLTRFVEYEKEGKVKKYPKRYTVFCRCQCQPVDKP